MIGYRKHHRRQVDLRFRKKYIKWRSAWFLEANKSDRKKEKMTRTKISTRKISKRKERYSYFRKSGDIFPFGLRKYFSCHEN